MKSQSEFGGVNDYVEWIRHKWRNRNCYFDRTVFRYQMEVKNGIKEAYSAITGKKTDEDVRNEKELGFELEDK